jgi:hypothetical protein
MAAPSNVTVPLRRISHDEAVDIIYQLATQLNLVIGGVRAFATKLDADAGTGLDTNYFATLFDASGSHPAKQITLTEGL